MLVLQWNVNGFHTRYERIQLLCQQYLPEVICIQETNFKLNNKGKMKGFKCFNKNRTNCHHASGGVATFVKENFSATELHISSDLEVVAIQISFPINICICNIYIPNSYAFESIEIYNIIKQLPKPFLLLGDFNSHNKLWGSCFNDSRGMKIETVIEDTNMILLNNGQPTHINISSGNFSTIDLTLSSTNLAHKCSWWVEETPHDSDHFPVFTKVDFPFDVDSNTYGIQKWKFSQANWKKYSDIINTSLHDFDFNNLMNENVDSIVTNFSDIIKQAANEAIGTYTPSLKTKFVPWWNEKCKEAIKISNHAYNRYKKHKTDDNKIEYKRTRALTRRILKESKSNSWKNFVSSISSNNSIRESWKKINAIQGHKRYSQIHFIQDGNKIIAQSADIANVLADTFVRNSSSQNFSDVFQEYKNEEEKEELPDDYDDKCSPLQLNNPITMEELLTTIESTNNSSPGPDNIPNILIKNLPTLGKEVLLDVYNYIWTKRVFPKIWKMAIVVPVAKPGKDPSKSDNYRPISLTCNMCKILEKIINKRLRWFLDTQKIIMIINSAFDLDTPLCHI